MFPRKEARLPAESETLNEVDMPCAGLQADLFLFSDPAVDTGGFGRTAQAVMLSDQVLKSFGISEPRSRLIQLKDLDSTLRSFLEVVMKYTQGESGVYCGAVTIAIRSVYSFTYHYF
jgi:hypothetical protein